MDPGVGQGVVGDAAFHDLFLKVFVYEQNVKSRNECLLVDEPGHC
jgi:hypothetical protein